MAKKDKKSNECEELIPMDVAEEVVANVLHDNKDDKQAKYFLYRICGLSPRVSARLCNYNEDYGYKLDRKFREDLNLRSRIEQITGSMPEQYKALCKLRLVEVADIEGRAMTEYKDNPKLAIEKPQLLKQVKQGAGVLSDDDKPAPTFVNIKYFQNILRAVHEDDAIDANYERVSLLDQETTEERTEGKQ
jgi:hypothetical protein